MTLMGAENAKPELINEHGEASWAGTKLVVVHPRNLLNYGVGSHRQMMRRWVEQLHQKGFLPAGRLSPDLESKSALIDTLSPGRIPASAILRDGAVLPRVVFVDDKWLTEHIEPFWYALIRPEDVVDIIPSPHRIPTRFAKHLGETSMSSMEFKVTLKKGEEIACWYGGNADFIELPSPYTASDIVKVEAGCGLARIEKRVLGEPDNAWCIFTSSRRTERPKRSLFKRRKS